MKVVRWDFLAVPWLRLGTSSEGSEGSVPGWGTKILRAAWWLKKEFFFFRWVWYVSAVEVLQMWASVFLSRGCFYEDGFDGPFCLV